MSGQVPNLLQWEVSGVDSGPQPQPQKGVQVGGRTLAGTQPSFLIWYTNEWTGLRPYLGISGGLFRPAVHTMPKPLPGPSRLSQILQNLNKAPRATLTGVKSITLTLAQRNDHFGAR